MQWIKILSLVHFFPGTLAVLIHGHASEKKTIAPLANISIQPSELSPFGHNCLCGEVLQEFASEKDDPIICQQACSATPQCHSFAVGKNKNKGLCSLFKQACFNLCFERTRTTDGLENDVYNLEKPCNHNCNCGSHLEEFPSGKGNYQLCHDACAANMDCASFGIWTDKNEGLCVLFDEYCVDDCPSPTNVADGFLNDVFNFADVRPDQHNCICGQVIEEHPTGKSTPDLCKDACLEVELCLSFALWTEKSPNAGTCSLYDNLCNVTCSNHVDDGFYNDVYNTMSG